jgi:hypothetical protein
MNYKRKFVRGIIGATGIALSIPVLQAQTNSPTSDPLLDVLIKKGILTEAEAKQVKHEAEHGPMESGSKWKLSPNIKGIELYGDFRGRYEQNTAENAAYNDRNRYRYRLRLGLNTTMFENFQIGLRLASGNPQFNPGGTLVGGSPITANQDLNSLDTRKFLWIDAAYAKWNAIKTDDWMLSTTIGKLDNPFQLSNMIWDYDIVPEGAAIQAAYNVNEKHALKGNAGIFVLDELNQGYAGGNTVPAGTPAAPSHDPFVYGAQGLFESKWTKKIETSVGLAAFAIDSKESLSSKVQPFYNSGNTRDANGFLKYNYDPIIGTAAAVYKLDSFPLYPGAFPLKLSGEFLHNPGAPANNEAYRVGLTLGKAGKKHSWEINYRYQRLEADAWFDALEDDDNGAYYATGNPQMAGTGKANGWFGGTNVRGHQIVAVYSITDFMNFSFIYYNNDLIINAPAQKSDASHFMAEFNWKF